VIAGDHGARGGPGRERAGGVLFAHGRDDELVGGDHELGRDGVAALGERALDEIASPLLLDLAGFGGLHGKNRLPPLRRSDEGGGVAGE
jgi:hypothetical protein